MKLREKRERLLVQLYLNARGQDFGAYYDLREVADEAGIVRGVGELHSIAENLVKSGMIDEAFSMGLGDEGGLSAAINAYGIESAEELIEQHPEYAGPSSEAVPAADRYVTLSDNQRSPVVSDLEDLKDAVGKSNEGSEEDRLVALSEVAAFEATLSQPRIAAELIERFVERILKWIVTKFSEALVGAIAGALIAKLIPLLNAG